MNDGIKSFKYSNDFSLAINEHSGTSEIFNPSRTSLDERWKDLKASLLPVNNLHFKQSEILDNI